MDENHTSSIILSPFLILFPFPSFLFLLFVQLRGSNFFFHQIVSGTCASHSLDSIKSTYLCAAAALDHQYNFHLYHNSHDHYHDDKRDEHLLAKIDHECALQPQIDIASTLGSDYLNTSTKCTPQTPCFCTSSYYIQHNHTQSHRRLSQDSGQFSVTWSLDLGGKEFLLESSFLKAAFEQSVKDYINNDILCSDDLSKKGVEFFGVEIVYETNKQTKKWKAVSGNGKCRGKPNKCKKPLELKALEVEIYDDDNEFRRLMADKVPIGANRAKVSEPNKQNKKWKAVSGNGKCKGNIAACKVPIQLKRAKVSDDDVFDDIYDDLLDKQQKIVRALHAKNDFCDIFLSSTIFDAFRERLLMAAFFNYDVDVGVINDLEGNLNLQYDVTFQPANTDGLDQIKEVALDAKDPVQINPICQDATQCFTQRGIMREIFQYYDLAWDDNKHECLYEGINCNEQDLVTHIWMGKSRYIFLLKMQILCFI